MTLYHLTGLICIHRRTDPSEKPARSPSQMSRAKLKSPFFGRDRILENETGFVIYDSFPVTEGHCLVVPHRIYADYFDSTQAELDGLHSLVFEAKRLLAEKFSPDGFNVGINCGEAAGQTVPHMHIHYSVQYTRPHNKVYASTPCAQLTSPRN